MAVEPEPAGAQRLESFSDGVFAVAITLLALDLRAPELEPASNQALLARWPAYVGVFTSFASVLLLYAPPAAAPGGAANVPPAATNGLILLLVTGSAYLTGIMSRFLLTEAAPYATALYAGYSAVLSLAVLLLWMIIRQAGVLRPDIPAATVRYLNRSIWVGIPYYAALAGLALWLPLLAVLLSNVSWVYWAVTLTRTERSASK